MASNLKRIENILLQEISRSSFVVNYFSCRAVVWYVFKKQHLFVYLNNGYLVLQLFMGQFRKQYLRDIFGKRALFEAVFTNV